MDTPTITEAITLAVGPIFLLVAIGGMLNVMTARLGRVVDRARTLEDLLVDDTDPDEIARHREELIALGKRMRQSNRAIYATSASGLFICLMVPLLFIEQFLPFSVAGVIALIFAVTMGLLLLGILFFLREISVASKSLKIRQELLR
ncbi:DUF2721 domain-containing protein [Parvularcula sp. ZS-1/3]|uniref:DUF2721 domain-containing protein n=1 Tax=Parvularcula mediterranea TaxID=2732508 RepID=A0A7Y3W4U8_9PROT|nr:DUF2721 domain-containing protein [Parvularcula mediterranea]NNU15622.1 DUF2721 domain-containing protein [Parvularcula mediterranea]